MPMPAIIPTTPRATVTKVPEGRTAVAPLLALTTPTVPVTVPKPTEPEPEVVH